VVLACRDGDRAESALVDIRSSVPAAEVQVLQLNLSDLESVRQFAGEFALRFDRLDLLVNNAGVMMPPKSLTKPK